MNRKDVYACISKPVEIFRNLAKYCQNCFYNLTNIIGDKRIPNATSFAIFKCISWKQKLSERKHTNKSIELFWNFMNYRYNCLCDSASEYSKYISIIDWIESFWNRIISKSRWSHREDVKEFWMIITISSSIYKL